MRIALRAMRMLGPITVLLALAFGFFLVPTPAHAQQQSASKPNSITSVAVGTAVFVVTYTKDGRTVADTFSLVVTQRAIATLSLFNATDPIRWVPAVNVGQTFCPYVLAKDSLGNVLTGNSVIISSSNPAIASVQHSVFCPDTTVDPAKVVIPLGLQVAPASPKSPH